MAKNKSTIRLWHRTDVANQDGSAPIHLIYQVKGQRKYYSIPDSLILAVNWDPEAKKAIYVAKSAKIPDHLYMAKKDIQELNERLDNLIADIKTIERSFSDRNVTFNAQMIIDALKNNKEPKTKKFSSTNQIYDFIDQYILEHTQTRVKGSLEVYKSLKKHLADYQRTYKREVSFEKIDYAFFQSFQNFLISDEGFTYNSKKELVPRKSVNNTTAAKQLSTLKTFLNYARIYGVEVSDKYRQFKIKKESLEVIALTNDEFETLYWLQLPNKRLEYVRDIFCFACGTGLRYSDLAQLKWQHIKNDEIKLTIKKTKEHLTVPLNPYSSAILKRYQGQLRPLPMISNQKLNVYLKELCEYAGINEPVEIVRFRGAKREATTYPKYELIGVHTARKTFATLSLEKGMNAEEVMSITGHKDYQSFKRYVKVTEQRKKAVMKKAWLMSKGKLKAI